MLNFILKTKTSVFDLEPGTVIRIYSSIIIIPQDKEMHFCCISSGFKTLSGSTMPLCRYITSEDDEYEILGKIEINPNMVL